MDQNQKSFFSWIKFASIVEFRLGRIRDFLGLGASVLVLALAGCGGGGGSGKDASLPAAPALPAVSAGALNITVTSVSIGSPPVVNFRVTDLAGAGVPGLAPADLRFNIAKLIPGSNGGPSSWQNYINRVRDGAVQGSQERSATGFAFGTLANHGDGSYTYTFATDITDPAANPCPAPCTDAGGNALDISYQPGATHRVTIQQGNSAFAKASGVYDFVPTAGAVASQREIVATATCNTCHGELTAHGTRVDTRLCVTCHNPGSWVAGTSNTTVDFKVMIHRIHYNNNGARLPSVIAGTPYLIGTRDFSNVTFPQDVRSCAKCHDGAITAQGDNWKNQPSAEACGACHDDVYFGVSPDPAKPYQTVAHPGGVVNDNGACALCHAAGRYTDNKDIVLAHNYPARYQAAVAKFKYNILSVAATTAGSKPVVTFSVTDPTNGDAPYDIKVDPHFTETASGTSRLAVSIGWNANGKLDFANEGSGADYAQPVSIDALATSVAGAAGTYTVTSPVAIPATQTGTLRVTIDGHPAGDFTTPGSFTDRLKVKSVYKDAAISGAVAARRTVVDVAKCDVCHGTLSLHGNNRTDEPGVCVVCHNPDATDRAQRIAAAAAGEESIDFKRMIHAIHAGQADKGGFRTTGVTIYGFGGRVNDFSGVVFPGKLNDCSVCHAGSSYQLTGIWHEPTANGILGSTVSTGASPTDPADNLRITPTAAVCSSCHDSAATKTHIEDPFGGGNFSATQAVIDTGPQEHCNFCHGPEGPWEVKDVHGVK